LTSRIPVLAAISFAAVAMTLGRAAAPARAAAEGALTPDEVFSRVNQRFSTLQDYECMADTECRAGKKQEVRSLQLWYKKPGMLRVKVLRGPSRGSEVVVSPRGEIRGRKGGFLKPVVIKLDEDDSRIRNLRGMPVTEFVWSTFYSGFRERAERAGAKLAVLPRRDPAGHVEVVLTSTAGGKSTREVLRFDPKLWLLEETEVFEGDTRVDYAVFHSFKTDTGLSDRLFHL